VDDKVVYEGQSQRSLGYVTITFPPARGRSVKIQLSGDPIDQPAGNVAELGQKNPTDTVQKKFAKRVLEIVEIEVYEPLLNIGH